MDAAEEADNNAGQAASVHAKPRQRRSLDAEMFKILSPATSKPAPACSASPPAKERHLSSKVDLLEEVNKIAAIISVLITHPCST